MQYLKKHWICEDLDALNEALAYALAFYMADGCYPSYRDETNEAPPGKRWESLVDDIKYITGLSIPQLLNNKNISKLYVLAATEVFNAAERFREPEGLELLYPKKEALEKALGITIVTSDDIPSLEKEKQPRTISENDHTGQPSSSGYKIHDILESYILHISKERTPPDFNSGNVNHGPLAGKTTWLRIDCALSFGQVYGIPPGTTLLTLPETKVYKNFMPKIQEHLAGSPIPNAERTP